MRPESANEYVQQELPIDIPAMVTVADVAKILYVSTDTVLRLIADGELKAMSIGRGRRMYRISMDDVESFIAARSVSP